MKIKEFMKLFESQYPTSLAFDGDNVGLLVGDRNDEITKVLVTCDVDMAVVEEAIEVGANLIDPLRRVVGKAVADSENREYAVAIVIPRGRGGADGECRRNQAEQQGECN